MVDCHFYIKIVSLRYESWIMRCLAIRACKMIVWNSVTWPKNADDVHFSCRGTDLSQDNLHQGYTHVFIATFESAEARHEYLVHPVHQAFSQELHAAVENIIIFPFTTTVTLKAAFWVALASRCEITLAYWQIRHFACWIASFFSWHIICFMCSS